LARVTRPIRLSVRVPQVPDERGPGYARTSGRSVRDAAVVADATARAVAEERAASFERLKRSPLTALDSVQVPFIETSLLPRPSSAPRRATAERGGSRRTLALRSRTSRSIRDVVGVELGPFPTRGLRPGAEQSPPSESTSLRTKVLPSGRESSTSAQASASDRPSVRVRTRGSRAVLVAEAARQARQRLSRSRCRRARRIRRAPPPSACSAPHPRQHLR